MIHCTLYQIKKKTNSTARPEDNLGIFKITANGEFKGEQSLLAPVVEFVGVTQTIIPPEGQEPQTFAPKFNYAYIEEFSRYYFITEWTYNRGRWIAQMTVDVLATYRDEILNLNCYVLRSSSFQNPAVIDNLFPAAADYESIALTVQPWENPGFDTGTIVFGVISQDGTTTTGAVCYYACSPITFRQIMNRLLSSPDYMSINTSEVGEHLQKALINPSQYIVSASFFPDNFHDGYTSLRTLFVGWWNIGQYQIAPLTAYPGLKWGGMWGFDIPQHPQEWQLGYWLKSSPYTTATLTFWPWGSMPIDSQKLIGYDELNVSYSVDLITGVGLLKVVARERESGKAALIATNTCQFSTPLQIAQITVDYGAMNTGTGVAAVAAGVATSGSSLINNVKSTASGFVSKIAAKAGQLAAKITGNDAALQAANAKLDAANATLAGRTEISIPQIAAGIGDALNSALASPVVKGGAGGVMMYDEGIRLEFFFRRILPQDGENFGAPACRFFRLGDISGFCKVLDAHFSSATATTNEQELVDGFLEGGFYLEYPQQIGEG